MRTGLYSIALLLFIAHITIAQKFPNLARTPPMGWNTWNKFACNVDETLIRASADAMVSSGLRDAGYVYVVIDDCWHGQRDSLGFIQPDPVKFPSGMKVLADYIHLKGLKIGIYSDAGNKTCGGRPGSRGHEYQDALTYASWGIDFLKYDWCDTEGLKAEGAYATMRDALYVAGHPIVLSLCEWGNNKPWTWAENVGQLWRTTGDIYHCFDCEDKHKDWSSWGVLQILDMQDGLRKYAGPDHWNDPDMMEVGNGMTVLEDRAHFSMWCMLAAPLMAGNDIAKMTKETHAILTNKEAIAIDQDELGVQGFRHHVKDSVETWFKPLQNGDWAVCFLNRKNVGQKVEMNWMNEIVSDLEVSKQDASFGKITYTIRNVWTKKDIDTTAKSFKSELGPHDVILLRLSPQKTTSKKRT
ncbi:MAG: glycoside hydrolase family 27 protein [Chryseolinea sp.]